MILDLAPVIHGGATRLAEQPGLPLVLAGLAVLAGLLRPGGAPKPAAPAVEDALLAALAPV